MSKKLIFSEEEQEKRNESCMFSGFDQEGGDLQLDSDNLNEIKYQANPFVISAKTLEVLKGLKLNKFSGLKKFNSLNSFDFIFISENNKKDSTRKKSKIFILI